MVARERHPVFRDRQLLMQVAVAAVVLLTPQELVARAAAAMAVKETDRHKERQERLTPAAAAVHLAVMVSPTQAVRAL
jgi:hypothetical protein